MTAQRSQSAALAGIRVLDLTDDRGDLAGMVLAQLGAEVIAVEPPGGLRSRAIEPFVDGHPGVDRSLHHLAYNRGKRSVVIDDEELKRLAAGADVLIECGARPVDLDAFRLANPALITASITPFGQQGPKASWHATDLIVAASSGMMAITGDADRPPVRVGHPQCWRFAAADAAAAVMVALHERARSGVGQHIDVSAQRSMISATQHTMMLTLVGADPIRRLAGGLELGPFKLQLVYGSADGHVSITYLFGPVIGPYTNRLFDWIHDDGFCGDDLGHKDWVGYAMDVLDGTDTVERLQQASAAIESWARTKTNEQLLNGALERRVLIAPISTTRDLLSMDQLRERRFWDEIRVAGRAAPVQVPGPVARLSVSPIRQLGPAPDLGADTADVLAEPTRTPSAPPRAAKVVGRALDGLKVCDLMWAVAGPWATRALADHGATVVRIESQTRPDVLRAGAPFRAEEGDFEGSLQYHSSNAGKYHLALDLTHDESREVLADLISRADVVTESFTPSAARRLGLGYEDVRAINPDVVMVSSCLMGSSGPLRDYPGFGTAGAAIAGFFPITGWPDRLPAGPYAAFTDYISPRLTVATILAALRYRDETGEGQHIDFSQMESALHLISPLLLDEALHGQTAVRDGNRDIGMAPHVVVPCGVPGGDRWLAIACETDEQWSALAKLMGVGALAGLTTRERLARVDELEDLVAGFAANREPGSLQGLLQEAGIPAHHVQNSAEVVADPQLEHLEHFVRVPHQMYGDTWVESAAYSMSRSAHDPRWGGPTLGEHSEVVLRDMLGYDDERFTELLLAGVLE